MRYLLLSALALTVACATTTTPQKEADVVVDSAPKTVVEKEKLDRETLLSRAGAIMSRDACDTERMAMPGVEGRAGLCFDDIVMFGVFTGCAEGKEDFCSVEGLAKMAAEGESAPIEKGSISLPSGQTLAVHIAKGDEGETVLVVDQGLPSGVKLAVCGYRQPMFAARCTEIFDEMLSGAPRPPSGVLALRGELEEDCEVEDGAGWMAECEDDEVYVAAIVPPEGSAPPTVDGLISSLKGGEVKVEVQAKKIDLEKHKDVKVYVLDAVEKEKPIRVYVVEDNLTPEVSLFACAWRNRPEHDAICLRLIDRVLP